MSASAPTQSDTALRAALPEPAGPCVMVIFGITGDLTKRLLFPALYYLAEQKLLPEEFAVAGYAIGDMDEQGLRDKLAGDVRAAVQHANGELVEWLVSRVRFVCAAFDDEEGWKHLHGVLAALDAEYHTGGNYLFYMATSPDFFLDVAQRVGHEGLLNQENGQWRRIIFEKPFGRDLVSARDLNHHLATFMREDQIYRIDHYLGKETVQNILVFRFANGIFEPIWNRRYIDHVQITVSETVGVERRGGYYDHTGALRDMAPNHLFQLLALTAMEPPSSFSAAALHNEQVKVLEAVPPISPLDCKHCTVRGQYVAGVIDNDPVTGYRQEPMVSPISQTETYVAMKVLVDNWRWAGVPFYIRTGKRLPKRKTEIAIQFRNPPLTLFRKSRTTLPQANRLIISVQPEESIFLQFDAKIPGPVVTTQQVDMRFSYADYFGVENRTGYETLLYDAIVGDSSLFKRSDMIEDGWTLVQPVLDAWSSGPGRDLQFYAAGSDGPDGADAMLENDRRAWRPL
ncbi:MAG TPA: glucose-6-phosphate dehydrogenase [Bryobacteraceae bacterium]|nr:glucose-6-phosphate dehydrogenase [Bryobacteraceae bacterium]